MSRVLVLSFSDLGMDPRVDRQIEALLTEHDVITAGFGRPRQDVPFVPLEAPREAPIARQITSQALRLAGRYAQAYWRHESTQRWADALASVGADLVLCNDAMGLPLAFAIAGGAPVVFDAHEHAPSEFESSRRWRLLVRPSVRWACRTFIPRASGMTVVCQGIADLYERETGVRGEVVLNAPARQAIAPSQIADQIRLVHFGGADPQRRVELMIEVVKLLPEEFSLDLILIGGHPDQPGPQGAAGRLGYVDELRELAAGDQRIRFLPPVPMPELPRFASRYDIGLYLLPPLHPNQRFALPNKFFEFVQGRLAVAIGPSPEMARLAREWDFGIVARDFEPATLASAIASTSRDRLGELKANADLAADVLCAEREAETTRRVVLAALDGRQP